MKKLLLVLSVLVCGVAIAETALEYRSGGFYAGQFSRITCADCTLTGNELTIPATIGGEAISPVSVTTPFVDAGVVTVSGALSAQSVTTPFVDAGVVTAGALNVAGAAVLGSTAAIAGVVSTHDIRPVAGTDAVLDLGTPTLRYRGVYLSGGILMSAAGTVTFSATAPTIGSGFGTNPAIVAGGAVGFEVNVGTGGSATSGVIGLPTATTGWVCNCADITTPGATITRMTANSVSSCTVTNVTMATGSSVAWTDSDKLWCTATAL